MASKVPQLYQKLTGQVATFRTKAINVATANLIGFAVRSSNSTLVGTWSIQYSNDFVDGVDDPTVDTKWDTYTLTSSPPGASGANQTFGIVLDDFEFKYVRLKFTFTSGTGDVEVWAQMKGT